MMQISIEMKNQHDDISLDVDQPSETVSIETMEVSEIVSDDYERLKNKPTLNGVVIRGDMYESDPTVPQWAKSPDKPQYTPEELKAVGEDNVITLEEIDAIFNGL